jgi:hypothetical protein
MPWIKRKKCRHCHRLFIPDPRNKDRQNYCGQPECRKASHVDSQRRWLQKPENRDYFRGPEHVGRVQRWRAQHPGYWRCKPRNRCDALQDPLIAQPVENNTDKVDFAQSALQDLLTSQPSVIIGLVAQLTGCALQDDIVMAVRRMQQFGDDILHPPNRGGCHDSQKSHLPRAYP